jgi:hypothetical protein
MNEETVGPPAASFFWPVFLPSLAFAVFMAWQVTIGVRQYLNLIRLEEQQTLLAGQAAQSENQLRALMMDVLALSETNKAAAEIMRKYNVKFTPSPDQPAAPGLQPAIEKATAPLPAADDAGPARPPGPL